ncbi:enoyl-CoA hydratase/isomerase family protein [Chloroflexota bacterium]
MAYETLLQERKGKIAYITLNRPQVLNAVNDTMHQELVDALHEFDEDKKSEVAILSGKGRCFSSGADVKQRQLRPREELARLGGPAGVRCPGGLLGLGETVNWKPVIAAVHGYTIGIGLGFAMGCDLVISAEDTKFQIAEVERGLGAPQSWVTAWFYGGGRFANEIAITGRFFSAQEAYRLGMVNKVVSLDQLIIEAERLASEILANPPLSVRCNVRVSRWYMQRMIEEATMYSKALKLYLTDDFRESALARVEKRKPVFKGK